MDISIKNEQMIDLINSIPDGILVLDSMGIAKFANQSAIHMFGGNSDDVINQELGLPVDQFHVSELDIVTNANSVSIAEMRIKEIIWEGKKAFIASLRDVTAKRQEQEIIEAVFDAFGAMNEGFFICNSQGKIAYANSSFERITGYKRSEIFGKSPSFLKSGIHTEDFFQKFWKQIEEEGQWQGIIWNKRQSGEIYPENLTVNTIKKDGKVHYYIAVFSDFTEGFKYTEELNKLRNETIDSEKKKSAFISRASHEIRTPMSGIIGYTELLSDTSLSMEQREYIEVIRTSSKSLLTMINEILDLSKLESGKNLSFNTVFSIRELIQELYQIFKLHTVKRDIVLGNYFSCKIPDWVEGEKEPLRQILTNLLSNAFKFTKSGKISFGIDSIEDQGSNLKLQITVSDTGLGIDDAFKSKIFEPFFRLESAQKDAGTISGTGLGLTIVSSILEKNGGKISINSILGKGSNFTFTYLVKKQDTQSKSTQWVKMGESRMERWKNTGRSLNVLVVEDNLSNQMYVKRVLEKKSIFVGVASNGKETLEKINLKNYDVILMDVRMPIMDGFETTEKIRSSSNPKIKNIPIIGLTGISSEEEKDKCQKVGMNSFIMKPAESELLIFEILKFVFP
jgi:PAS domain S-box-containing protein